VEAICTAAAAIIQEGGLPSLTTNAVAKRAGVSITAVYAYFPDKWAIVHELFERFERLRAEALVGLFEDFDTVEDWVPVIDETWDRMARFRSFVNTDALDDSIVFVRERGQKRPPTTDELTTGERALSEAAG